VTVVVNGQQKIISIKISPEAVDWPPAAVDGTR
jgi:DNA-binding protein YbaB